MRGCRPWTDEEVAWIKERFTGRQARRNRVLFIVGVNTGRRISQMLTLRVRDVVDGQGRVVDRVFFARAVVKGKTEGHSVRLNAAAREALQPWVKHLTETSPVGIDAMLFPSEAGVNRPISRRQAWWVIKQAVRGLAGKQGTHSLRKTFANRVYQHFLREQARGKPVDAFRSTSKALSHGDIRSTDAYLSFLEADVDAAVEAIGR